MASRELNVEIGGTGRGLLLSGDNEDTVLAMRVFGVSRKRHPR